MRPSYKVRKLAAKVQPKKLPPGVQYAKIELNEACPKGTVPVLRVVDKDLPNDVSNLNKSQFPSYDPLDANVEFAGIFTKTTTDKKYQLVGAEMSVWNPKVRELSNIVQLQSQLKQRLELTSNKYNLGGLFGEMTGFYLSSSVMQKNKGVSQCHNLACLGFVQTNTKVPVGSVIDKVSDYGTDDPVVLHFSMISDGDDLPRTGKWWVYYNNDLHPIGYFPDALFFELNSGADTLKWGGYVFTGPNDKSSLQMGSGKFDIGIYQRTAFMTNVQYVGASNLLVQSPNDIQTAESRCYLVGDESYKDDTLGYTFCFGRNGGKYCYHDASK
ncbi:protein neprosin-like [Castanea sativa]|uniref:protein neprosin-like n=1 Tax=Castanea sativa TaxID=21020 RepID=UPI003F65007E